MRASPAAEPRAPAPFLPIFLDDEDDADILEAERQLAEYLQSSSVPRAAVPGGTVARSGAGPLRGARQGSLRLGPERRVRSASPAGLRGRAAAPRRAAPEVQARLRELLAERVCALGEVVLQQDGALRELRALSHADPPELLSLSEENAQLARLDQEVVEEAVELSAAYRSLETEANEVHRQAEDLQRERETLLDRFREVQDSEARACDEAAAASRDLDNEEHMIRDVARSLSAAIEERSRRVGECEARARSAEEELVEHEAGSTAHKAEAVAAARAYAVAMERRRQRDGELAEKLQALRRRLDATTTDAQRLRLELAKARAVSAKLEAGAEALALEVASSERSAEDTERKALGVARELLETSQGISQLRAEAAAHHDLKLEVEEAQREVASLEYRLDAARRDLESQRLRRAVLPLDAAPECDLEATQALAVQEALRDAWEAEARDRRETEAALQAQEAGLRPIREGLVRLAAAARRFQGDIAPMEAPLQPPALDGEALPDVARCLCDSLEAMSTEALRRATEAQREGRAFRAARLRPAPRAAMEPCAIGVAAERSPGM